MATNINTGISPLETVDRPTTLPTKPGEGMEGVNTITPTIASLQESLSKDVKGAQASLLAAQQERGIKDPEQVKRFQERGIRLGGRVVAQEQFNKAMQAQQNAINSLMTNSGLSNQVEQIQISNGINNRLNVLKKDLIKGGLAFEKQLNVYKSNELQKQAGRNMMMKVAGTVAGGVIGGYFGGPAGAAGGASVGSSVFSGGG